MTLPSVHLFNHILTTKTYCEAKTWTDLTNQPIESPGPVYNLETLR